MADARKGEHHANRAREMLRQGRLADAERELRAAVASDPSRGDWMLNLGWTLEAIGRQEEALQLYRQSASLLPTPPKKPYPAPAPVACATCTGREVI
jgi:Flp pilus assembly protein TadD